jgi:hypothetical protein
MTYYTHINRGVIDANRKHGRNDPPICFRRGRNGKATYAHEVTLPAGSRILYSAHKPLLPCGARLVIVSNDPPQVSS